MNIIEFLKSDEGDVRLVFENKWIYWDRDSKMWVVMIQEYHKRVKTVNVTASEENAIQSLRGK